jgi:Ca-activated chloride channel homolog
LAHNFTLKRNEGYPRHIFLLTDGCVSNCSQVTKLISQNNKYSRVHGIGIGSGCSKELIIEGAEKGRGKYVFIGDDEDPSEKIIGLLTDSLSPVISKIRLNFDKEVVESIIPNPEAMPYILKD